MIKKSIQRLIVLICIMATVLAGFSHAEEPPLSVTVVCESDDVIFEGMEWKLYRVGTRLGEGLYELYGAFSEYDVNISGATVTELTAAASTLASYTVTDSIPADSTGVFDSDATVVFDSFSDGSELVNGVYLLTSEAVSNEEYIYTPAPMLFELGNWSETNADLVLSPKFEVEEIPAEPRDFTVTKIWEDEDNKAGIRCESIEVEIYCNGELFKTVELNEGNGWKYSWTDTEECEWEVKEKEVPDGYTVVYRSDSTDFVIVNTYDLSIITVTPIPDDPKLPQTGQTKWPIPVLLILGVTFVVLGIVVLNRDEE